MDLIEYLSVGILTLLILNSNYVFSSGETDCTCQPVEKKFDENIEDHLNKTCRKCYVFTYEFTLHQDWAYYLCVNSSNASNHTPLLVTVREYLSVMSFQVPQTFNDRGKSSFTNVCHTLCPLVNYFDEKLNASKQSIFVELASQEETKVEFAVKMSKINHFIINKEEAFTVNISPSQPQVMQYNLEDGVRAVRIEATSPDESCMILAIQNIQCPFSDFEKTVEQSGYYQTLMTQSGIAITKNFPMEQLYIVLLMKTSNDDCVEWSRKEIVPGQLLSKKVTVKIVPAITDEQYYEAVFGALGFYVLIYFFSFVICMFIRTRSLPLNQHIDIERPDIQNYGTSSDVERPDIQSYGTSSDADNRSLQDVFGQIPIDETDMDTLPDAEVDKNVIRTKNILYVSDLARKNEKVLSKRSKVYSWNLFTIAVFYALPVVQLVYINQRIVNLTGNQDICYYNFLCSHQVWVFSDFNHIYSNIGYGLLGILFICLVWRRESLCYSASKDRSIAGPKETTGIPYHFGLLYAMGLALIIEGVLSACYHVCPNKANFQFDTAFMYVISVVCMLKLYQARHPDITAEAHTTWMVLSVVIFCGVGGVLNGGIVYWIIFVVVHLIVTAMVSVKIYYMGCIKFNKGILKRVYQNVQRDRASKSYYPQYKGRFILLAVATLINTGLDVYALVKQPVDFASFILAVFILNLGMYLFYYIIMKIRHRERIGWIPIMYICLSFVCWIVAGFFFLEHNTSWKVTPAESREKNKHCLILNFYDHHDVWHFISSCALFFFFMVLFTLDDDLDKTPRTQIMVF